MARPILICLVWLAILVVSSRGAPNDYPQTGSVSKESKSEESVSESAEYPEEYQNKKESGGGRKSVESHEEPYQEETTRSTERVRRDDEAPHQHHHHDHEHEHEHEHEEDQGGSASAEVGGHQEAEDQPSAEESQEEDKEDHAGTR